MTNSVSFVVNPVPENADNAWNFAFFFSNPVIIKAIEAALTKRKETKTASKVGKRKYKLLILIPSLSIYLLKQVFILISRKSILADGLRCSAKNILNETINKSKTKWINSDFNG